MPEAASLSVLYLTSHAWISKVDSGTSSGSLVSYTCASLALSTNFPSTTVISSISYM